MKFFICLLVCLLALLSCKTNPTAPITKTSPSIVGHVTSGCPGESLVAGVSVLTVPPTYAVKTDSKGNYTLNDIPPGKYLVQIPSRYVVGSDTSKSFSVIISYITSDTITVTAGQVDTVNILAPCGAEICDCAQDTFRFNQTSATASSGNGLSLTLTIGSVAYHSGDSISITIDEKNTLATENKANIANAWPIQGLTLQPCVFNEPFGIAILQGYYDAKSVSSGIPLILFPPGIYNCPADPVITNYDFQPSSDLNYGIKLAGFWTGNLTLINSFPCANPVECNSTFNNFTPGIYTIVGGDEWGALVILHFTVL
ncbi:MAG TPA: carboxypeptidase-like regulatory domain-containing protein [Chitinivibrionales bacterium]|nr:carboxypeptidase-like regulatory domain-containing protein [Chitinivibrionales bacterium]